MNHNNKRVKFSDRADSMGLLAEEYPLEKEMRLIFKYIDFGHLFQDGFLNYENDIVMHIYKKLK